MINMIPIKYKKRLRFALEAILGPKQDEDVCEWQQKPTSHKAIVFLGVTDWAYRFQRSQHLATGLAKSGRTVLFIEPQMNLSRNRVKPPYTITQLQENLYLVHLSTLKNRFIYADLADSNSLKMMAGSLRRILADLNLDQVTYIVAHPFWTDLVKEVGEHIIYDCMDDHAGFKETSKRIIAKEAKLAAMADLVVVTAQKLRGKMEAFTDPGKIKLIGNGGDYEHFAKTPEKSTHDVVLGYLGAVNDWFDAHLLEKMLKAGYRIELIGRIENDRVKKLAKKYLRLKLIGEKPYRELPQLMAEWSVCLLPFMINPLTEATQPVKVFEYLATGRPVLATKLPELLPYQQVIEFMDKSDEVKSKIEACLKTSAELRLERRRIAKENDWQERIKQWESIL